MNEFSRLEKLAKQLKLEYPKGTRIELEQMGSDPRPIESGMRGTVDHVDDLATIHCVFDNGRRLGLIYDEDQFHKLTPREVFEEKLEKVSEEKQVRFIDKVNKEAMPCFEWVGMRHAYQTGDMSCPTDFLKLLYEKFLEVYDPVLESGMGMVTVPGVVETADGTVYVALIDIDVDSSGEHWGTAFFTPEGILQDHDEESWSKIRPFIPYKYWYAPTIENDCHVDWDECPDVVREMLSEATGEDFFIEGGISY